MADSVRRRRKEAQDRLGRWAIIGAVLAAVSLGSVWVYFTRQQIILDKETLCPVDGPWTLTVVLIDHTDQLTTVQRETLRKRLDDIKADIGRYSAIELYTVAPIGETLLLPRVKLCNPGRKEDINQLYGNPRLVEQKWTKDFSARLDQVLNDMLKPGDAPTSPIMESIQSVAISALTGHRLDGLPRRLVVVSDMLQHTPVYSQYDKIAPFEEFQRSPYYLHVKTDLSGVNVEIIYIRRDTRRHVQGKAHIEFWQRYIADTGGVLTGVRALEG